MAPAPLPLPDSTIQGNIRQDDDVIKATIVNSIDKVYTKF